MIHRYGYAICVDEGGEGDGQRRFDFDFDFPPAIAAMSLENMANWSTTSESSRRTSARSEASESDRCTSVFSLAAGFGRSRSPVTTTRLRSPTYTRRRMEIFASRSRSASLLVISGCGSNSETPLTAHPGRPARPARWEYVSADFGMSAWTTSSTPGKSNPRAATSVATRMSTSPKRKPARVASRAGCGRSPWSDATLRSRLPESNSCADEE